MNRFFFAAAGLSLLFFSCKNDSQNSQENTLSTPDTLRTEPVSTKGASTYSITEGIVYWAAKKAVGEPHNGTIMLGEGSLLANNGQLIKGNGLINMASIAVVNMKDNGEKTELENHLKSADFFDVKSFPEGAFKFNDVLPSNNPAFNAVISGELTLKGKTNPVNIPIKVTFKGDEVDIESQSFLINRTQWGVNFRSGALGTAKDKLIEDVVLLSLRIKAKKVG
ncbi:MAG: YceI family protein [Saprospiraceae bacterium]|nr:YceI family protein [Saprospiraceae bacterium]